jgi:hypothetical protein
MGTDHAERRAMILGASGGKVAAITAAQAAVMMPSDDIKYDSVKRLIGPAGTDVIDVLFMIDPGMAWPKQIEWLRRPAVVVVGDDPGTCWGQGGADAWRCTSRLRRWTRAAMIHGAAAEPEHYAEVVRATLKVGRVALIETTSANVHGWAEALRCPRTLLVLPRGGLHPVPEKEEVR